MEKLIDQFIYYKMKILIVGLVSVRSIDYFDRVRSTYWFLPSIMAIFSMIFAIVLFRVDQRIPNSMLYDKWYIVHADSSNVIPILMGIAGSALGVVGVVFPVTLVPLTTAASQYGPILIRSFLRDTTTQVVLGMYASTLGFCIVVVMSYQSDIGNVPLISITFAVILFLISLGMLLYFFHHVAEGLQASKIIENVGNEIENEIRIERSSFEDSQSSNGLGDDEYKLRATIMDQGNAVIATKPGYIRAIDYNELLKIAEKNNITFLLQCAAGDFLNPGNHLLLVWPPSYESSEFNANINRAFILGDNRTMQQDIEYGITSLVIIASRALSPAINDPITPAMCLDRLGVALSMLADSNSKSSFYYDNDRKLRIIADPKSFEHTTGLAFNLIRQYGRFNADVMISILQTINSVAEHIHNNAEKDVLLQHAQLVLEDSDCSLPSSYDKERVHQAYNKALETVNKKVYKI